MIAQIEEKEKSDPIKTMQAIMYLVEKWRCVKSSAIMNCWKNTGKIESFTHSESESITVVKNEQN